MGINEKLVKEYLLNNPIILTISADAIAKGIGNKISTEEVSKSLIKLKEAGLIEVSLI